MPVASQPRPAGQNRILLVDDHPVTREGIRSLVEGDPHFVVCAQADSRAAALALAVEVKPDAAILDVALRGENGLDVLKEWRAAGATFPVLVVSMHDQEFYGERARRAGAAGYVMKQHASDRILGALRRVLAGETAFHDPAKPAPLPRREAALRKAGGGGVESLSEREIEVLRLLGDGYGTREIAEKLALSIKTIDTYREHLKLKLNLTGADQLVRFAVQWAGSQKR
jgi:DNA-binding NarL/FixJ family response regulator